LPHGTTQDVVAALPRQMKIIDLSADFRLKDVGAYAEWYGQPHRAPALQTEAIYGLTEWQRGTIQAAGARLIANPGCYPTATQLPLIPLLRAGVLRPEGIVIDAKSGVSGAGKELKAGNLFAEVAEGMQAYGVGRHRHMPEIEAGLSAAAGQPVTVSFTPHLVPMNRGMFATIYGQLTAGANAATVRQLWQAAYASEPFIQLLPDGLLPSTRNVRGTNLCQLAVCDDRVTGRVIILSAIDNLMKGASGQAVQNMNVMLGLPETTGLLHTALVP
jgi:N-acetyl-gamma-glutamyl-phosphate reductase